MTIKPFSFIKPNSQTPAPKAPSIEERIESLRGEREQLEQEAEKLGLSGKDPSSPIVVSHNNIVARIDAELEVLTRRQEQGAKPASRAEDAKAKPANEAAPKQVIRRMPNKSGVYPPGTFLDIYA